MESLRNCHGILQNQTKSYVNLFFWLSIVVLWIDAKDFSVGNLCGSQQLGYEWILKPCLRAMDPNYWAMAMGNPRLAASLCYLALSLASLF